MLMMEEAAVETRIQYFQTKEFEKSLNLAMLTGGQTKKRVTAVKAILGNLAAADPFTDFARPTNHGEDRIPHCVKYDLGDGWRLVTCQHDKTCGFLFVGKHDDVDHWLDEHRGQRFAVENGRATLAPGVGAQIPYGKPFRAGHHDKPLIDRLPTELADFVLAGISRSVVRPLEDLDGRASSLDLMQAAGAIEDAEKFDLVVTVFNQLIAGNLDGAETIVKLRMGLISGFDELDENELLEVADGPEIRRIRIGSVEYEAWLQDFEKRTTWYEWFLYLHPEQEKVMLANYDGSAQLSGVSGSGKTCVAVRRALRLADAPDGKVLVVTLNRSLAGLLRQLVDAAATDEVVKSRIEVTSFFELAQRLLFKFEPHNKKIYEDVTWKLNEHVDEIFREFYRRWLRFDAARALIPLHMSMNARGVNGEVYLRDEFDWIRSAVGRDERTQYLDMPRIGRRFAITNDRRQDILTGLEGWEAKMKHVGVVDYLGLTSALSNHLSEIASEYTNIIIDEAQDFGTTELRIIRKLVAPGPNDLFLCGDVAQTILPKHRYLPDAGITDIARARIVQNYRNSREILIAAYDVLRNNLHEEMLDSEDLEILDPKFANFSGCVPMALLADSLEEEIAYARAYAETRLAQGAKTVCIGFAGFSARDIREFAGRCGVTALEGAYDPSADKLVFSDLEQTKGYEFDTLIILQCADGVLPPKDAPNEEAHRAACKLYVAMTRAKRELILSFHGAASPWITAVNESIGTALWSEFEELNAEYLAGIPELLPEIQPGSTRTDAFKLTGPQFLYTPHARGLSLETQQKLVELVEGREAVKGGSARRIRWRDVGSLIADLNKSGSYDAFVGKVVAGELRGLNDNMLV